MGSEEFYHFFCSSLFFFAFLRFFFKFLCSLSLSLVFLEDKGKRLQFTAKWGISLRPHLHRPRAKLLEWFGLLAIEWATQPRGLCLFFLHLLKRGVESQDPIKALNLWTPNEITELQQLLFEVLRGRVP